MFFAEVTWNLGQILNTDPNKKNKKKTNKNK